ncbi:hypothetical protein R1sor_027257 [Riccia sorocarpa]|uniref:Telomerase activating protein Est1 n=1 Tax=Riccia sorocarpa TaxID=122646 RepID=A0ABD3GFU7_9MARC
MTLPSNPTSSAATSRALAQQRYNQALELEKQLRSLLQGKGPFDPSVRALRNRICESYEAVILEDHEFAESHEVEQAIWRLHYKCIEEFRARIRKSTAAAAAAASAPAIPMPGAKVPARRDSSQKILAVFKSFLAEATGFYHNLILKLRAKHGLPQDYSPFEVEKGARDEKRTAELRSCDLSCHRCLIFLGDLARYKESHGDADVRSRDWSVAAGYYQQAISLWPSSGNPHNQLAVLATYVGDELLAVYRYFRSLAVESPFLTARDNLIILFEKNRNHYAQLPSNESATPGKVDSSKASDKTKASRGDRIVPVGDGALKLAVKDHQLEGVEIGELRKRFRLRFVRLNGILFTKTSLETFPDVYSATVRELEELLSPEDTILEAGLGTDHRSGIGTGSGGAAGFLQVVAILIFTVHNINWVPDSHHPTYAEILQRSALYQHAFTAAFECAGRLMRRCAESKVVSKSPLLPAMLVFLEWLACRPEMAAGSDIDEKQAHARNFFWRQSIAILNSCAEACKRNGEVGLEGGLASVAGYADDDGVGGVSLWEDYELRGFVPIIPAQLTLDYSKRSPRVGLGDKKEREVRLQRLIAAGRAIASALDGTEKGICYDYEEGKFSMAGEQRAKKDAHHVDAPNVLDNGRALPKAIVEEETASGSSWDKITAEDRNSLLSSESAFPAREEEDEEVIVFKPMVKDQSSNSVSGGVWKNMTSGQIPSVKADVVPCVSAGQAGTENVVMSRGLSGVGQMPSVDVQRSVSTTSSIRQFGLPDTSLAATPVSANGRQFVPETSLLPIHSLGFAEPVPVISVSGSVGTSPSSTASSPLAGFMASLPGTHANVTEDVRGVNGTYGFPPSSAEDWLNRVTGSSSGQTASWDANIFGNGAEKFAGVIGQPKQAAVSNSLWSTNLNGVTLPGLSKLSLAASDYGRPQGSGLGGLPHSAMSLDSLIQTSVKDAPTISNGILSSGDFHMLSSRNGAINRSYAQSSTVSADSESSDSELVKPSRALRTPSDAVATNSATSSTSVQNPGEAPSTGGVRSAMRPPPGFGPLPTKVASVVTSVSVENSHQQNVSKSAPSPRTSDKDETQAVDDYGWLDDYTQKGTTGQIGYYQGQGSSLYSSDYGIWSSGAMNTVAPGKVTPATTGYPFPGMGSSQQEQPSNRREVENQRQQYTLLEQLLQQQEQQHLESQRLGYRVDQPQIQYGPQQFEYDPQQQQYQLQQHQLLMLQQQQQQQPPQWYGQYHSRDPFVS